MNTLSPPTESWSWADQISTYRLWGLFAFYAFSGVLAGAIFQIELGWAVFSAFSSALALGFAFMVSATGALLGVLLAWAWVLSNWAPKKALLFFGLLQLIGVVFLGLGSFSGTWLYVAAFVFGLGLGAVWLGVPAVIAGGRGGFTTFVLIFGSFLILGNFLRPVASAAGGFIIATFGLWGSVALTGSIVLLGLLLLIPANPVFFDEPPPLRSHSFAPRRRSPIIVALLGFVPLYSFYWLYLIHGEVAHLAPSRSLLSPRAAIWTGFVPFLSLVSMATLINQLNFRASQLGKPPYSSPLAMFFWSLIFFPLGMALIQSAINGLSEPSRIGIKTHQAPPLLSTATDGDEQPAIENTMNNIEYTSRETASASPEGWSWAKIINTYRFWALLIFYVMSVAVSAFPFRAGAVVFVVDGLSADVSALGSIFAVYSFAAIPGVLLAWAWALSDWQPKRGLILFGLIQLIGVVFLGMSLSIGIWVFYVAAFISGLGFGAVFLTVPAVIADGKAGVAVFVLVFGVILISEVFFGMIAQLALAGLLGVFGLLTVVTLIGALLLLGIFFLLPADPRFFAEPPPPEPS